MGKLALLLILASLSFSAYGQNYFKGTIIDEKKEPIISASVILKDDTGTIITYNYTDELGKYSLNYKGNHLKATDRKSLAFSDKGAWFGFGFLEHSKMQGGFSGPFLMTEQYGVWLSSSFISLHLTDKNEQELIDWKSALVSQNSYNSHLEQQFQNEKVSVKQQLVYLSGHSALQKTSITNKTGKVITLYPSYNASLFLNDLKLSDENKILKIVSSKSTAIGYIQFLNSNPAIEITKEGYKAQTEKLTLKPNETKDIVVSQTFIFPQYSWQKEKETIAKTTFNTLLNNTQKEKENLLAQLIAKKKAIYKDNIYSDLIAKLELTLQNNTRIAAEGLKHGGLFPSYNYE